MEKKTATAKKALPDVRQELLTLRDEIRLRIHLGTMELKTAWEKLEPRLEEVEKYASEISEASRRAMHDLVRRARALRVALHKLSEQHKVARHTP